MVANPNKSSAKFYTELVYKKPKPRTRGQHMRGL
jgi:hypothetical protein